MTGDAKPRSQEFNGLALRALFPSTEEERLDAMWEALSAVREAVKRLPSDDRRRVLGMVELVFIE